MITALLLIPALILDALLGEPKWIWSRVPHPAILMGRLIARLDRTLNKSNRKRLKGLCAVLIIVAFGSALGFFLNQLGPVPSIILAAILLAQRSLVEHVEDVATGLERNVQSGRDAVAMIVSRDTRNMTESQVARSAIESGAENFSDGVIAPAFWFLVAGLPGILVYKLVNTADSMIGYRNAKYQEFGWAAARLDDVLNLIPARLTALLIVLQNRSLRALSEIAKDAHLHRSPNAGWPEAAMARVVGCALAGPRSYDGTMRDFPWVNPKGRKQVGAPDIRAAVTTLWRVWSLFLLVTVALAFLF